ncbi:MAG: WG repeat-containing protein [Clostridiales bacterium]|jgi:hypothetical protein|nr:WG repeat-containing protein [Clostridiales bacterium]
MKKNKLKVLAAIATAATLCLTLPSDSAFGYQIGEPLGWVYNSDIRAYIDGHQILSYIVNDKACVVSEDLRNYGFDVSWDEASRASKIAFTGGKETTPVAGPSPTPVINGAKAFRYVYTDIVAYVDGKKVDSFNIEGRLVIYFSELEAFGELAYDDSTRTARLTTRSGDVPIAEAALAPTPPADSSDATDFRFLFPPSDQFASVEKKIGDGHYLVKMGEEGANGSYNICDENGRIISDVNFETREYLKGNKLFVKRKGGELVAIDLKSGQASLSGFGTIGNLGDMDFDYIPAIIDGKWGAADMGLRIFIEPAYDALDCLSDSDLYLVGNSFGRDLLWGLVDNAEKEVLPIAYSSISKSAPGEVIAQTPDGRTGVLSAEDGHVIVPLQRQGFTFDTSSYQQMFESYWGLFEGRIYQRIAINGKAGAIDNRLDIVVPPEYDTLYFRQNGIAIASKEGKFRALQLDSNGGEAIPLFDGEYEDIDTLYYSEPAGQSGGMMRTDHIADLFSIKVDGLYGLYRSAGRFLKEEIFKPTYKSIAADGLAQVIYLRSADDKTFLADFNGKLLTDEGYDSANYLGNDIFLLKDSGQFGIFHKDAKSLEAINGDYDDISLVNPITKRALAAAGEKKGVVNFDGSIAVAIEYDIISDEEAMINNPDAFGLNVSVAKKGGEWGAIDSEGRIIVPFDTDARFTSQPYREGNAQIEVWPSLSRDSETGKITGLTFEPDENGSKAEFTVSSRDGSALFGSCKGKGAVLVQSSDSAS